ncbi:MAG: ABC transporter transmembrane domain-containing protein, partial [Acidimicrobiales bacterium]
MTDGFPVANFQTVRRYLRAIVRDERRPAGAVLLLFAGASVAALVGPRVLGDVVESTARSGHALSHVNEAVLVFLAALVAQGVFSTWASRTAGHLSARLLARLRGDFVEAVLSLPVGVVEEAGTGELQTRASSDVEQLTWSIRQAAPLMAIAAAQSVAIVIALVVTAPALSLVLVPVVPVLLLGTRWYLKRARPGYEKTMASWDKLNASVQETAATGRTIETFGLAHRRAEEVDDRIRGWIATERYTLRLRTVYFPVTEFCYVVPLVLAVMLGGLLHASGRVSVAAATAAVLYVQLLISPVDTVLSYLDEIQLGTASLSRLLGVREVPAPEPSTSAPSSEQIDAADVRYSYRTGHDVLHGIDLAPRPGSRVALV